MGRNIHDFKESVYTSPREPMKSVLLVRRRAIETSSAKSRLTLRRAPSLRAQEELRTDRHEQDQGAGETDEPERKQNGRSEASRRSNVAVTFHG